MSTLTGFKFRLHCKNILRVEMGRELEVSFHAFRFGLRLVLLLALVLTVASISKSRSLPATILSGRKVISLRHKAPQSEGLVAALSDTAWGCITAHTLKLHNRLGNFKLRLALLEPLVLNIACIVSARPARVKIRSWWKRVTIWLQRPQQEVTVHVVPAATWGYRRK